MSIYEVPEGRRYWVVRSDGGLYYQHFLRYGFIALGHLNQLEIDVRDCNEFIPAESWLKSSVANNSALKGTKKRQESVSLNQLKSFIYDMKAGDWVITVGTHSLKVGIIESERAYIDNQKATIYLDTEQKRRLDMNYMLRRKVSWGPSIPRRSLPYGLLSSLKANQTVFNLDKHWQAIYHTLYPAFIFNDELYFSLKIRSEKEISNIKVVQVLSFLNEIELIANELENNLSSNNFDDLFQSYLQNDLFTLTTKAQFYSPGDIWNKINFSGKNNRRIAYAFVAYSMLFGNEHAGVDGIIDLETRHKLWQIVIDRLEQKEMDHVVSGLELSKPSYDTAILESHDQQKKLTNNL